MSQFGSFPQFQTRALRPGSPAPLGATPDQSGVNFAIVSEYATAVHLCLFDSPAASRESTTIPLTERTGDVWHVFVPGLRTGQLYGYRVSGPWDPSAGHRFNPEKVVLDPYAKAIGRVPVIDESLFDHVAGSDTEMRPDPTDNARSAPLGRVVESTFDWRGDRPPKTRWDQTVIYEVHVRGFSARHPEIPHDLRGTFAGLATDAALDHFLRLGVTALELMPIHAHTDEPAVVARGLTNYWGYNTLNFFAPDPRFARPGHADDVIDDFKRLVRACHAAGLEVILDVVYNHTAEGDHLGPTLSWRGIDHARAYRLRPGDPSRYEDVTGCGNTVDARSAPMLQLILDSLRYWVDEMHVDGFRFDLASALLRGQREVDWRSAFLQAIQDDPVLSGVKLIAEPWDATAEGYQLGGFPAPWREWNDRYRDGVRRFWRGEAGLLPEIATRLAGSRDVFGSDGRSPLAGINFVTAHDGFTLTDLVSYNAKHNDLNGEENRDGHNNNLSWNCGVEGPTDDEAIRSLRARQRRNFLLTLVVSQGVPMLSGGDELGRTQRGNNNAYCQDSEVSWTPWHPPEADYELLAFTRRVLALRRECVLFCQHRFLQGRNGAAADVLWLTPDGDEMTERDWHDASRRSIGMLLDDAWLVILSANETPTRFRTPNSHDWELLIDTTNPELPPLTIPGGQTYPMAAFSAVVLRANRQETD